MFYIGWPASLEVVCINKKERFNFCNTVEILNLFLFSQGVEKREHKKTIHCSGSAGGVYVHYGCKAFSLSRYSFCSAQFFSSGAGCKGR